MTHSVSPLDYFLDTVFNDPTLNEDLSEIEKIAVKALLGELATAINPSALTPTAPEMLAPNSVLEPGMELDSKATNAEALLNTLLQEQSDAALVDWLNSHLESAFSILEILANRPLGKQKPDLLRRVELQLVATSLGVADLRKMVESPLRSLSRQSHASSWRTQIRRYLLQEFNIINNLLR